MKRVALLAMLVLMAGQIVQASEPLSPIQQAMLRIRNERIEHMVVFNSRGEQIAETTGNRTSAEKPNDVSLSNATVLHNHPPGTVAWFSPGDYLLAYQWYVRRMVVIAPVWMNGEKLYLECTLQRGADQRWPKLDVSGFLYRIKQIGYHAAWAEFATQHDLIYTCPVLP